MTPIFGCYFKSKIIYEEESNPENLLKKMIHPPLPMKRATPLTTKSAIIIIPLTVFVALL